MTTTTTSRSWRWPTAAAQLAKLGALVAARGFALRTDESPGLYSARKLEWQADDGVRVGWVEYHQHDVRALWVDAADPAACEAMLDSLCGELPLWSDEALQRDAHAQDLSVRLHAVRTWALAALIEPVRAAGMVEAVVALARHEHPVARLAALDLAYVIAPPHREATLALARERAEQDREYSAQWQDLVANIESSA